MYVFFISSNNYNKILYDVTLPFTFSILFVVIWFILNQFNKGEKYMMDIIKYQRKYLEIKLEKIKDDIYYKNINVH